jgi:hypothetical protein
MPLLLSWSTRCTHKWLTIRKVKFIYRIFSQRINSCQLFFLSVERLFLISVFDFQLLFQSDVDLFPIYWSYMHYFLFSVFDRKLLIHMKILLLSVHDFFHSTVVHPFPSCWYFHWFYSSSWRMIFFQPAYPWKVFLLSVVDLSLSCWSFSSCYSLLLLICSKLLILNLRILSVSDYSPRCWNFSSCYSFQLKIFLQATVFDPFPSSWYFLMQIWLTIQLLIPFFQPGSSWQLFLLSVVEPLLSCWSFSSSHSFVQFLIFFQAAECWSLARCSVHLCMILISFFNFLRMHHKTSNAAFYLKFFPNLLCL